MGKHTNFVPSAPVMPPKHAASSYMDSIALSEPNMAAPTFLGKPVLASAALTSGVDTVTERKAVRANVEQHTEAQLKHLTSAQAQKMYDPAGQPVSIDLAEAQAQAGDKVASAFVR